MHHFLEKSAKAILKTTFVQSQTPTVLHTHRWVEAHAYIGIKRLKSSQNSISYPTETAKS